MIKRYYSEYTGQQIDEAVKVIIENNIQLTDLSPELVAEIKTWGGGAVVDPELENRVESLENYIYSMDYSKLAFDTTEIVINTQTGNTNSMLGYAILDQLILG